MRTRNSIVNLAVSLGAQGFNILLQFLSRFIFVRYFSEEYLGVNGLFTEILTIFSLAELGIGVSMMYGLYNVIAKKDQDEISRLMNLYRRMYALVGGAVAGIGCVMLPFLEFFTGETDIPHIRIIYLMYLANSVLSYFFSYKQTLIRADQKEYIVSGVTQLVKCIQVIVQIGIIVATKNFYLYLGIQIMCQIMTNVILAVIADRKYPYIKKKNLGLPNKEVRTDIYRHIRAMAFHRFGSVFVLNTDNLLISMFIGLGTVGIYSNYRLVTNNLRTVADYIYNALTASVGNLTATEEPKRTLFVYHSLQMGLSLLFGWMSVCLVTLFNPFIELVFGERYLLPFSTVVVIVLDFYIMEMRQVTLCFRNAMGLFWYDRYKPVFEVTINLGLSLLLVQRFGISGVLMGTIISSLATNFWVEPLVFFKHGIKINWKKNLAGYFFRYGKYTLFIVVCAVVSLSIRKALGSVTLFSFIVSGLSACLIYGAAAFALFGRKDEWKYLLKAVAGMVKRKRGENKE